VGRPNVEPNVTAGDANPVPSAAEALAELDDHETLVLALYERDLDGLPATIRRALDQALDEAPTTEGDKP
jgi:DNA-binding GntR family transcriptional regulator